MLLRQFWLKLWWYIKSVMTKNFPHEEHKKVFITRTCTLRNRFGLRPGHIPKNRSESQSGDNFPDCLDVRSRVGTAQSRPWRPKPEGWNSLGRTHWLRTVRLPCRVCGRLFVATSHSQCHLPWNGY